MIVNDVAGANLRNMSAHKVHGVGALVLLAAIGLGLGKANATQSGSATSFDFEHISCTNEPNQIRVVVSNVKEPIGLLTADLYNNDAENFLNVNGRALQVRFAAKTPETKFCIIAPSSGPYALAVYHDENANMLFDKGAFGLPVEPWGLSGNPKIRFGPPPISKTLFEVSDGGAKVALRLRNK